MIGRKVVVIFLILFLVFLSQKKNIMNTMYYEEIRIPDEMIIFTPDEYPKTEPTNEIREHEDKSVIESRGEKYKITAYDLSASKHGITHFGADLNGQSWYTARVVAVDPKIIPLGKQVKISFIEEEYKIYDGIYNGVDSGSAIKGKILDFFIGDNETTKEALEFGVTKAYVEILD